MARRVGRRFPCVVAVLVALAAFGVGAFVDPSAAAQSRERRPWLGVVLERGRDAGARVGHVVRGSPAERAGVHEGDTIVALDARPTTNERDVLDSIAAHRVGDHVELAVAHADNRRVVRVLLGAMPSSDEILRMDLVGAPAPTWTDVASASGEFPETLDALRGKVVLLDFWATWCGPCRMMSSKLGALQWQYGARGLSVVGLSTEDSQRVASFARQTSMSYPVASDETGETTRSYGIVNLPTVVVIDKHGVVRDVAIGYDATSAARLDGAVRQLLAEP
jgi:thiol-disulfide isomerase/thioredoxin